MLPECALFPPYSAVIVIEFGGLSDGVYDTEHEAADKLQKGRLNVPPALPSLHDTMPSGIIGRLDVSVTRAVNWVPVPWLIVTVFGVMVVVVLANLDIAKVNCPLFALWDKSPA